jgi:hypothetical protein
MNWNGADISYSRLHATWGYGATAHISEKRRATRRTWIARPTLRIFLMRPSLRSPQAGDGDDVVTVLKHTDHVCDIALSASTPMLAKSMAWVEKSFPTFN